MCLHVEGYHTGRQEMSVGVLPERTHIASSGSRKKLSGFSSFSSACKGESPLPSPVRFSLLEQNKSNPLRGLLLLCSRRESNSQPRFRRPLLYPFNYRSMKILWSESSASAVAPRFTWSYGGQCAPWGIRTLDRLVKSQLLYQLS